MEPLQGRDTSPRIARITRISAERVCGNLRGQRAICEGGGHRVFDETKIRKIWDICKRSSDFCY